MRKSKTTTKPSAKQRQAPDKMIKSWAQAVCARGDDSEAHTSALLLLLSEIEGSSQDWDRVDEIVGIAKIAAFCNSDQADKAMRDLVSHLRTQTGLRLVKTG